MRSSTPSSSESSRPFSLVLSASLILLLLTSNPIYAQAPTTTVPTNGTNTNTTTPATNGTTTNTTAPQASPTPRTIPTTCGVSVGQFIINSPKSSAIVNVGSRVNVTWSYSPLTNTTMYPLNKLSLYYQNSDGSNPLPDQWKLVTDLNRTAVWYIWTVPQVTDGNYQVRLVSDDLDTQLQTTRCNPDGFPVASSSGKFRINNNLPLPTYVDSMGPSSAAVARRWDMSSEKVLALVMAVLIGMVGTVLTVCL
ncbi:hypothetical protein HDV00_007794 [Rhizophlyctis rosea]|nr:hypothetical protein HDV00_007794 [Rhizophlyctis rosea]